MALDYIKRIPGYGIFQRPSLCLSASSIAIFVLAVLVLCVGGCGAVQKDTINQISFSHDGKKVLFDRCRSEGCQIQVYELSTGELSAYQSPANERWTMARYSDDGKKIVLSVIPMGDEYLNLADMQIAVMDPDGKNIRKITTGPGAKIYPTFSHSGRKVLYARAGYIRKRGGTPAMDFDAWEVDLDTGRERRLTFYKYFSMSKLAYFPDDERFIFDGRDPASYPGIKDRDKEAMRKVYEELWQERKTIHGIQVMRGTEILPEVYDINIGVSPSRPMLSKDGTRLVFAGGHGELFYLYAPDGNHKLINRGGSVDSVDLSSNGELLGIIYANWIIAVYDLQTGSSRRYSLDEQPPNRVYGRLKKEEIKVLPEQPKFIINQ
jgi:WD40 repeat protein